MSEKTMDIYSKRGAKVMGQFDRDGQVMHGYDHDREHANKYLKPDTVYTVDKTEVHSWHTKVYLKEFPGVAFNSVHFISAPNVKKKSATKHKH